MMNSPINKKILVVVDMQNDFINGALGTKEAEGIVDNVCKKIEEFEGDIIVTMDTHDERFYSESLEGKKLPVPHCLINHDKMTVSEGHKINEQIMNALRKKVFTERNDFVAPVTLDSQPNKLRQNVYFLRKPTFGSPALPTIIYNSLDTHYEDVSEIEVCGLCTDICVVSNALILRAQFSNTPIKVDSSCCAGTTPENHEAALKVMKSCQIEVM